MQPNKTMTQDLTDRIELWITNDYHTYLYWTTRCKAVCLKEQDHEGRVDGEKASRMLGQEMRLHYEEWIEESDDGTDKLPGMYREILTVVGAYLDWRSIAEGFVRAYGESL